MNVSAHASSLLASMDLLQSGVLEQSGVLNVGFCGHPEGVVAAGRQVLTAADAMHILVSGPRMPRAIVS